MRMIATYTAGMIDRSFNQSNRQRRKLTTDNSRLTMKGACVLSVCAFVALYFFVYVAGHGHEHSHGHHGHEHHGHEHHGHHHHGHQHHGHQHHGHHHGHEHHGHQHHGHYHEDEEPAFNRYSREMNEEKEPPVQKPKPTKKAESNTKMPMPPKPARTTMCIWFEAIASTILISAAPFFILFFIPLTGNTAEQKPLLKVLLAFASGGLLGDAFLHLIPHAISPHSHLEEHSHSHSHDHGHSHGDSHSHSHDMVVGFWVLGGIIAFLIVEKFVRYVKGGHGHSHGHTHDASPAKKTDKKTTEDDKIPNGDKKETTRKRKTSDGSEKSTSDEPKPESSEKSSTEKEPKEIKVAGYLNLAADFTHNFTDGLAIGASFLVSRNVGIVTTLTILLHEVPHEIGDFAILVQSGCNKKKAMYLQLSTATGALAGTFCGLLAHNIGTAATLWILPFTAGGFIYIATVSVIPELLEETKIGQSIKEIIGLLFGVLMMVVIAQLE